jgi:hypothetical protein
LIVAAGAAADAGALIVAGAGAMLQDVSTRAILCAAVAVLALISAAPAAGKSLPIAADEVTCKEAAYGDADALPGMREAGAATMQSGRALGSHWNGRAGRFTAKAPLLISGSEPVTLSVPARLQGRLALTYGRTPMATTLTFFPCEDRAVTFFPGALVFLRREPISLLVEADAGRALLRLGVFPSR